MTHFEKLFSALLIGLAMLSATALAIMAFEVRHARAEPATFIHGGLAKDGERYETYLKSHWKPGRQSPAQLIAAGSKAMGKDAREAARNYAMAAVGQPANAEGWIGLAQALLAIEPDPNKGSERYDLPVNASGAAYLAQERASNKAQRARALAVLSQALKRRAFWRPAIESLKARWRAVPNAPAALRERIDATRFPEYYGPFANVLLGEDLSTWIEHYTTDGTRRWQVLDPQGRPAFTVTAPSAVRLQLVSQTTAWGTEADADGLQHVVRYRVR